MSKSWEFDPTKFHQINDVISVLKSGDFEESIRRFESTLDDEPHESSHEEDEDPITKFLHIPRGTYETSLDKIFDSGRSLLMDVGDWLFSLGVSVFQESQSTDAAMIIATDFNFGATIRFSSIFEKYQEYTTDFHEIDNTITIIERQSIERILFEGYGPISEIVSSYGSSGREKGIFRYLCNLMAISLLWPILGKDAPCEKCSLIGWPTVVREKSKGGPPRNCDRLCPPCEVNHRREVERRRQAEYRKKTRKPNRKRIKT